ncbi:AraC family transcriptional regulator [Desulfosporosinus sp.]|uniref:AraC family transcriptional regulator n=1 Tax=Desulfosporosinus sp. TaxID=157907 RepID=UPI0025BE5770|nr:AraC family transcriptional regulator [Desulfosporosinus sp.]MBC2727353.1 helix-turn-helix transcriptional regulator [Desulfosporosinus sp.]
MVNLKKTFGEGPYPFPIQNMEDFFDVYASDTTVMLEPKPHVSFDLYPGSHNHSDFEFLISYSVLKYLGVENKRLNIGPKYILPINSDQPHGPKDAMLSVRFFTISFNKDFLNLVNNSIHKTDEIIFNNTVFEIDSEFEYLIRLFMQESKAKQAGYDLILKCLSTQIATKIIRQTGGNKESTNRYKTFVPDKSIRKAIELLQDNYNKDYTLEEVAKAANISPYHFIRVFKQQTGKTPFIFLLDIKLEKAKEMLKNKKLSITEVCYASGFKSMSHFATVFKKKNGVSPSSYRIKL